MVTNRSHTRPSHFSACDKKAGFYLGTSIYSYNIYPHGKQKDNITQVAQMAVLISSILILVIITVTVTYIIMSIKPIIIYVHCCDS